MSALAKWTVENGPIPPVIVGQIFPLWSSPTNRAGTTPYNQSTGIFWMAQLKPSDFITLRKKRMDWTMAGTHRQWIYAFKLTVLGKWEIDNWKRCEFVKVEILAAWFCGNMNKIFKYFGVLFDLLFFILAAHTHSPNPLKTLQRTIRNMTISIRTPDSNVSHTLSPSSLPWVPNEKKPHACGLTLDSSMKMVMSFWTWLCCPVVFHRENHIAALSFRPPRSWHAWVSSGRPVSLCPGAKPCW